MRQTGYRTRLIGKWHLGYAPRFGPLLSGYDEFFGPMSGAVDYFSDTSFDGTRNLYQGNEPVHGQLGYLTDVLSHRACDFIRRHTDRNSTDADAERFMLSVHYTAPHWPWETRDDEV